jgi:hypothetical protein
VEDGKRSKKIERNPLQRVFIEILLREIALIFCLFAQGLIDAQSSVVLKVPVGASPARDGRQR